MIRDSAPLVITTSFSTTRSAKTSPSRSVRARSIIRSSICAVPAEHRLERAVELGERDLGQEPEAAEVHAEDRHVARRRCAIRPAMPMSVPSPPSTTIRSHASGRSSRATVGRPAAGRRAAAVSVSNTGSTSRASSQPASSASTPAAASRPLRRRDRPCDQHVEPARLTAAPQVQQEFAIAFHAGNRRLGHPGARQS